MLIGILTGCASAKDLCERGVAFTADEPYGTINDAILSVPPDGGTICICPGEFNEYVRIDPTLSGESGPGLGMVVLEGAGIGVTTLRRLPDTAGGPMIASWMTPVTVKNLSVLDAAGTDQGLGAGIAAAGDMTLENVAIEGSIDRYGGALGAHPWDVEESIQLTVRDSVIQGNESVGVDGGGEQPR